VLPPPAEPLNVRIVPKNGYFKAASSIAVPVSPMTRLNSQLANAWNMAKRIYAEFFEDSIPTVAGGITFFAFLALFPAIASVVSLFGFFGDRGSITRVLDQISGFLPGGAITVLRAELLRLAAQKAGPLDLTFFVSTGIAVWSASGGFKALLEGLNAAFEVKETRDFLRLTGHALIFTIAAIFFSVVAIGLGLVFPIWITGGRVNFLIRTIVEISVWPLSFLAAMLALALIYRFGPDRRHPRWRWITWGSATAALLWLLGTRLFSWYVEHYGSYDRVYGTLGALVGFLTWVWLSLVVLLLGAEINCELERRDTK
jgi:membrane protein